MTNAISATNPKTSGWVCATLVVEVLDQRGRAADVDVARSPAEACGSCSRIQSTVVAGAQVLGVDRQHRGQQRAAVVVAEHRRLHRHDVGRLAHLLLDRVEQRLFGGRRCALPSGNVTSTRIGPERAGPERLGRRVDPAADLVGGFELALHAVAQRHRRTPGRPASAAGGRGRAPTATACASPSRSSASRTGTAWCLGGGTSAGSEDRLGGGPCRTSPAPRGSGWSTSAPRRRPRGSRRWPSTDSTGVLIR